MTDGGRANQRLNGDGLPVSPAVLRQQILYRGYAVWTSPIASLEADRRARNTSGTEALFLAKLS